MKFLRQYGQLEKFIFLPIRQKILPQGKSPTLGTNIN